MTGFIRLIAVWAVLVTQGCSNPESSAHVRQIISFGTTVEVTVAGVSEVEANQALAKIEQELHYMHDQWHAWRPSSVTQLNQQLQSQQTFEIDDALLPLIRQSKSLYQSSLTYFNPAIGKLIELWGFYKDDPNENKSLPNKDAIKRLLSSNPNMNDIVIKESNVIGLNSDLQLDFGGYAKGFGVEQLIEQLQSLNINNAMVNAGAI